MTLSLLDRLAGAVLGAGPSYPPMPASSVAGELDAVFRFVTLPR